MMKCRSVLQSADTGVSWLFRAANSQRLQQGLPVGEHAGCSGRHGPVSVREVGLNAVSEHLRGTGVSVRCGRSKGLQAAHTPSRLQGEPACPAGQGLPSLLGGCTHSSSSAIPDSKEERAGGAHLNLPSFMPGWS